jgi:PEGA domain-containing protein
MSDHRPPSYRWTVLLSLGLAAGLAVAWVAARALRPGGGAAEPPREPAEAIDTDRYIGPIETELEPGTGERVAPFSGFAVSIETEPGDALVTIAGVERGESPVLAGVECKPGTKVPVRVAKTGFRAARASTVCRTDALVKLIIRLSPLGGTR